MTLINPDGAGFVIDDVDGYLAECDRDGVEPVVDVGGGMLIPLRELVADDDR